MPISALCNSVSSTPIASRQWQVMSILYFIHMKYSLCISIDRAWAINLSQATLFASPPPSSRFSFAMSICQRASVHVFFGKPMSSPPAYWPKESRRNWSVETTRTCTGAVTRVEDSGPSY